MAITFGLDISHHQDLALSLAQCRRDGCEFVFLKATEGASFTDSEFVQNLAEARAAGMLVAAYVFVRQNATPAQHVARTRSVVPLDVPLILDIELPLSGAPPTKAHSEACLNAYRAAGYKVPLSYIPKWFWRDHWRSPNLAGWPPLWSSRYPDNVVGTLADEWADVPAHYWDGYGGLPVAVLQFTSSARIAGHQSLDANAFRGTRAELAALLGGRPQENDMQQTDMFLPWDPNIMSGTGGKMSVNQWMSGVLARLDAQGAEIKGLVAAVAALSNDQDLTKDEVTKIVQDAVKQNIHITGTVEIGPAQ